MAGDHPTIPDPPPAKTRNAVASRIPLRRKDGRAEPLPVCHRFGRGMGRNGLLAVDSVEVDAEGAVTGAVRFGPAECSRHKLCKLIATNRVRFGKTWTGSPLELLPAAGSAADRQFWGDALRQCFEDAWGWTDFIAH
jgi:hypothetical protein